MKDVFKTTKFDIIVIIAAVACALFFAGARIFETRAQKLRPNTALIFVNNVLYKRAGLDKDATLDILSNRMQAEIKGNKIRIARSDCPRKVCAHSGWIPGASRTLACVPNKVFIEIEKNAPVFLDATAY